MVSRKVHCDDVGIAAGEVAHRGPAAVARSIVDEHDLLVRADCSASRRGQALVQRIEARFFVEARDDDRQLGHGSLDKDAAGVLPYGVKSRRTGPPIDHHDRPMPLI
jgi:hypothetical protein